MKMFYENSSKIVNNTDAKSALNTSSPFKTVLLEKSKKQGNLQIKI